jgi:hypothetical protein
MSLTREQILEACGRPLKVQKFSAPELGGDGHVYLRELSASEVDRHTVSINDGENKNLTNFRARLVALALCDEQGKRLMQPGDAAQLGQLPSTAINRIDDAVREMNGMQKEAEEAMAKNSESEGGDGSGSSSQKTSSEH